MPDELNAQQAFLTWEQSAAVSQTDATLFILGLKGLTHHLLLFTAGYHLNSLSKNWGPL